MVPVVGSFFVLFDLVVFLINIFLACTSKVSAIDDSAEFRLGIRLNAQMDRGK